MLRLLINSLGTDFYKQHAGFFLFGLYILFGVVEPSQLIQYHESLLLAALSSPFGIILVFTSWFLYSIKAYLFITQKFTSPDYNFVKEISSQAKAIQLTLWLKFYSVILLPILIYVILLIGLSFKHQFYTSLVSIIIVFIALIFGLAWLKFNSLTFGFLKQKGQLLQIRFKIKRPFFSWPIFYLFNEQLLMLLMCKTVSLILFKGVLWMFADVGNDIRILLTALLASVLSHSVLVFTLLKFEIEYLSSVRSLPVKTSKRLGNWLITFAVILIPEWFFFTVAAQCDLYAVFKGLLFGLAGLLFFLIILYSVKLNTKSYLKWLMFFFFIAMWAILSTYYIPFILLLTTYSIMFYLLRFNKIDLRGMEN